MKKLVFNAFVVATLAGVVACDEDELNNSDGSNELKLGEYYIEAESIVSYLYNLADKAFNDSLFNAGDSTEIWGVPVVTNSSSITEFRFGNGITGTDGITRKGKVLVTETGDFKTSGSLSLSFDNFVVANKSIGDATTNMMIATGSTPGNFNINVANFGIDNEFAYSGSKDINWTSGYDTPNDDSDDVYSFGGTFSGSETASNNGISGNVTEAFVYDRSCEDGILAGIVDFTLSGDSISATGGTIDFQKEDGCNNSVIITINTENGGRLTFPKTFNGF